MIRILVVISVAFLFLAGCSQEKEIQMPERMPEDFNFSVSFGYGDINKNEINTYNDTVTKDLITKGTATADLTFSDDELQTIYNKMKGINIMGEKQFPVQKSCSQTPSNIDSWKVTVNGETKSLAWTNEYCDMTKDAEQLKELRAYIWHLVESKDNYKALPAAVGGYD
ncbi:hypothetical protein M3194_09140 [Paenibacillus glycanilyticus]|uniref:hypothetical protein n=1 Tax=Paenibacillus glycanilyticus TaxID=126569 RepID=UPI00203DA478|nr:hypothetical protein [Paenibacillus glycanilyticus]MCM3627531.1 hypothetical protein [Paenibacillus glycanilyticus]